MRTETTTRELYQYDELTDEAKEKARAWWRTVSEGDDFWSECAIDDYADNVLPLLGVTVAYTANRPHTVTRPAIYFSGFWSQGDGASFHGNYMYVRGAAKAIRRDLPTATALHEVADVLQRVQARHFYKLTASVGSGHGGGNYCHEHTVAIWVERTDGVEVPAADAELVADALRDVMRWIYQSLEAEYEYQNSDEQVEENIKANEYEFTIDGGRA